MASRRRRWIDTVFNGQTLAPGNTTSTIVLTEGIPDNEMKGMTLVRLIIQLNLLASIIDDDTGVQRMAIGIGLAGQEAIQASGTGIALPELQDEFPSSGWLWRAQYAVVSNAVPGFPYPVIEKDLRAQRKLMYGAPYIRFVNINSQGTAFSVDIVGVVRALYLLP